MTDLHTHILFGIDDGARDLEMSKEMLKKEISDGVDTVVLTPHFDISHQNIDEFSSLRDQNAEILKREIGSQIRLLCAAEVVADPFLTEEKNLDKLCIEGTKVILLELPSENVSLWLENLIYKLRLLNYTPVLVHIERYRVLCNLKTLKKLTDAGAVTQINCSSFINSGIFMRSFIKKAASKKLLHLLGSDCHSSSWRAPCFKEGVEAATKLCSRFFADSLIKNNESIVSNGYLGYDGFLV